MIRSAPRRAVALTGLQSLAVDALSVRFAGEPDGISFYLAKSTDPAMHGGSAEITSQWPFGTARYSGPWKIPDSAITDGWVSISDNLAFRPKV